MIWLNGQIIENEKAISARDRGLLLGDGIFETFLLCDGVPAYFDDHYDRLERGLVEIQLEIGYLGSEVAMAIAELADRMGLNAGRASARLTVTRGASERGLVFPQKNKAAPTIMISVAEPAAQFTGSRQMMISRYRRAAESIGSRVKAISYLDNILARNEAAHAGRDDAIMLNEHGRVACATAANIFVLSADGSKLMTPPLGEGGLAGIVRARVILGADTLGIKTEQRPLGVEDLSPGYIFLTNSLIGLAPAALGESVRAPRPFERLKSWYEADLINSCKKPSGA